MEQAWLAPDRYAEVVKTTLDYRAQHDHAAAPLDFVASGHTRGDSAEQARAKVAAFEAAGATWWTEWLDDRVGGYEASLAHIRRGPAGGR